jgi:hypothetical protein
MQWHVMAMDSQEPVFVEALGKVIADAEAANKARWRKLAEQFPGQVPTTAAEFIDFFASEYHWTLNHIAGLDDYQMYAFVNAALRRRKAHYPAYWRIEGKAIILHRDLLGRNPEEEPKPEKGKQNPGRPPDTDAKEDKRISDAWKTGQHKRLADLAQVLGLHEKDVAKAIDRHRKRLKRNSDESE